MSIRIRHCLTILCDNCGVEATWGDDEGVPHFDSVDEAVRSLSGDGDDEDFTHEWLMTQVEHICPKCRASRACAVVGHDWSEWVTADARGIPMARRWCYRCSHHEMALPEASS